MAQLKIPSVRVVTTSEKYTLTHSRHTSICFPSGPQSDVPPPPGVTIGSTYPMDDLPDPTTNEPS